MSIEENKALVRRVYDLLDKKELEASYEYFAPQFVFHSPNGDWSLAQVKKFDTGFYTAFPDMNVTIEDIIAEGDKVSVRVAYRGTQMGEFIGITSTGKRIDITNANTFIISAGKLVEGWNVTDVRLIQQLGVIPEQ